MIQRQSFADMSQQFYTINDYQIDKYNQLGEGCQGAIFPCLKISTQEQIVCKAIKINYVNEATYEREIDIYNQLKLGEYGENIVKIFDVTILEEEQEKILLEFMEKCDTDLGKIIKEQSQSGQWMNFDTIVDYTGQIIKGYSKLRSCNIIHRDLKPDNILIKYINGQPKVKISDFGLGKVLNSDVAITNTGTPLYKAPEVQNQSIDVYTNKADIFSLGIILYQIVYKNNPPFKLQNSRDVQKFQQTLEHTPLCCQPQEGIPLDFLQLIEKMITYSPVHRIGWDQLENHPYFATYFPQSPKRVVHFQDYYEYIGAVYQQSLKIQQILSQLPQEIPWQVLRNQLIQYVIMKFQEELNIMITSIIKEENQLRQSISVVQHLRNSNTNQAKIKQFLDSNHIVLDEAKQKQIIEGLQRNIEELLNEQQQDRFFKDFYLKISTMKDMNNLDLFDYWLLQFQVIYKECLRPWLMKYQQQKVIQLNQLYQLEKFSHILEEHPKTNYTNSYHQQIYSKIYLTETMVNYLKEKELL